jgi:hypothetical protein
MPRLFARFSGIVRKYLCQYESRLQYPDVIGRNPDARTIAVEIPTFHYVMEYRNRQANMSATGFVPVTSRYRDDRSTD